MGSPKVAVIMLNYNQEAETAACLSRLSASPYPAFEVLVVDNGSRRNPEPLLKDRFPSVAWKILRENTGFSAGCNQGIRWGLDRGADMVLLLNNDAVVPSDFLERLVETASSDDAIGIVGAVLYRPGSDRPFLGGMRFDFLRAKVVRVIPDDIHSVKRVPSVSGSCFLVKRKVFEEVGFLDERFFIYFEETDFCYRARRMGMVAVCDSRVKVLHEEGTTFGRESAAYRYLYIRNRLLFLSKHCPFWIRPWSFGVRTAKEAALSLFFLLKGRGDLSRAIVRGTLDFWRGTFGRGSLERFFHGTHP